MMSDKFYARREYVCKDGNGVRIVRNGCRTFWKIYQIGLYIWNGGEILVQIFLLIFFIILFYF